MHIAMINTIKKHTFQSKLCHFFTIMNFVIRLYFAQFHTFNKIHNNNIFIFFCVFFINIWDNNIINIFKICSKSFNVFYFVFKIHLFKKNMSITLKMLFNIDLFEEIIAHEFINNPLYFSNTVHHCLINITPLHFYRIHISIFVACFKYDGY